MRSRDAELPRRVEDHNLLVTVRGDGEEIRDVVCKLWLPRRVNERPIMFLYPQGPRSNILADIPPPFAVEGRIDNGGSIITIRADEVWSEYASTRWLGGSRDETVLQGKPIDLRVIHRRSKEPLSGLIDVHTTYRLTGCPPLHTGVIRESKLTGDTEVKKAWTFDFTLASGTTLNFAQHFRYEERADGTLSWPELVATRTHQIDASAFETLDHATLDEIDDFLTLVAFGSHFRTACVSVTSSTDTGDYVQFFRGNISMPPDDQDLDDIGAPIDLAHFSEFLHSAYATFIATGPHQLVRHALALTAVREERTLESSFTTLYAALETILLWYRRNHNLELIVEDEEKWQTLKADARTYLKSHPSLQGDTPLEKERRKWIAAKVGELRRVPFSIALRLFCKEYDVRLDDLWPLFDNDPAEASLTDIRNRLIHGSAFDRNQHHALIGAAEHMRWVVERVLLAVLRWPVERSYVRADYLSEHLTAITQMPEDRAALRRRAPGDEVSAAATETPSQPDTPREE